ncbi:MAG TPA: uroporphyrinogen decarboxylase family protein [Candidatus Brocadiia bacterium]|nr:uroporphyrinogen decarboxylase family protein [Candidatus Brocadiia bacterium]
MTHRQRVEAALRHREPDRTPYFEYVLLPPVAEQLLGRRYVDYAGDREGWRRLAAETGWEKAVRQYAVDRADMAALLDHDMLYVCPNPVPDGATRPGPSAAECPEDDPVSRLERRNERVAASLGRRSDDRFLVYAYLREELRRRELDLPVLAPAYYHGVWTDVDLMQTMVLEPEVAHRHFALATQRALADVEAYVSLGLDQVGVGGDFAGTRLLISPDAYRRFIVPEVRTVVRRIHQAGLWAVNASDGNLWPVLDDFLLGCEVDGYLETDMRAGMDLARLKAARGDRVTLYGNMDCGNVLSFSAPEEVARLTAECLKAGQGNGGHIFCASNAITDSIPLDNYLAMVNAYRKTFGLPDLARL